MRFVPALCLPTTAHPKGGHGGSLFRNCRYSAISNTSRLFYLLRLLALASLLVGIATPALAVTYSNNGDGTVTDPTTGLTWMRCSMGQTWTGSTCTGTATTYTWDQATALTGAVSFAGQSDWRLPTLAELQSIVDTAYFPYINPTAFPNTPAWSFWSSTPNQNSYSPSLLVVYFAGASNYNYYYSYARLVRAVPPTCTLTATPASIAAGGTSTLTASCNPAATSYVWTGGTCTGTSAASCTGTPLATTTYTVAGVNLVGTGAAASATVTVIPPPTCTLTATPASIAIGGTSTLTASCTPAASAYVWTGGTCAGTTAASCTVTPSATTTYTVAGTNSAGAGAAASATVTVTSTSTPVCTLTATPASIAAGSTSTLTASCSPTPTSYTWSANTGFTTTVTTGTVSPTVTTTYTVAGVNGAGTGTAASATVTVATGSSTPAAATLISPSGTIATTTPTYTWNAVSNAAYYLLSDAQNVQTWYSAAQAGCASGTGTCSVTGSALSAGSYTWYLQTYNTNGYGPWSSGRSFTVSSVSTASCTASEVMISGDLVWSPFKAVQLWPVPPASGSEDLGRAIQFVADSTAFPNGVQLLIIDEHQPTYAKDVVVSECPHRFTPALATCAVAAGSYSVLNLRFGAATISADCPLTPGGTYYINFREYVTGTSSRGTVASQFNIYNRTD